MPDRSSPVNLQSQQSQTINPPTITGTNFRAVAVYNSSPDQLLVQYGSNTDLLQPLQANIYPIVAQSYGLTVTPIDGLPAGTYVGIVQAAWYRPEEAIPVFPVALAPFPGGSQLIAQTLPFVPPVFPPQLPEEHVAVPSGAGSLLLQPIIGPQHGGVGATFVKIVGDQSGTVYLPATNFLNLGSVLINPALDTTYHIVWSITGGGGTYVNGLNVFGIAQASPVGPPGLPIPDVTQLVGGTDGTDLRSLLTDTSGRLIVEQADPNISGLIPQVPTLAVTATSSTATLIGAPSSGAWYLFGMDLVINPQAESWWSLTSGGQIFAEVQTGPATTADHVELAGQRVTTAIAAVNNTSNGRITVRYAPGP